MKKRPLSFSIRFVTCLIVALQGILLTLIATFLLNQSYLSLFMTPSSTTEVIVIKSVDEQKVASVTAYLEEEALSQNLFIKKVTVMLSQEGSFRGLRLGVFGDVFKNQETLERSFMGRKVLSADALSSLLLTPDSNAYIGQGHSEHYQIGSLPQFLFGTQIQIRKLQALTEETRTVNGIYHIEGLSPLQKEQFLMGLSQISGQPVESFQDGLSGFQIDDSLKLILLITCLGLVLFLQLSLLLVLTLKELYRFSVLSLLGWTKWSFIKEVYRPTLLASSGVLPLIIIGGTILSENGFLTPVFFSTFFLLGVLNIVLVLVLAATASLFIWFANTLKLIKRDFSKKHYLVAAMAFYAMINVCLLALCSYLDQPVKEVFRNVNIANQWKSVSNYRVLQSMSVGEDQSSIAGQSQKLYSDVFAWYSSLADEDGVYLIQTKHFSQQLLEQYRYSNLYRSLPSQPLTKMTVSPNYLSQMGITLPEEVVKKAKAGTRLYLLSDALSEQEKERIKLWLEEADTRSLSEYDLPTLFLKERQFEFMDYPSQDFFPWETSLVVSRSPVIYVATPENMTFRENESLLAIGLNNGYLKFSKEAQERFLTDDYFEKYHLKDNQLVFLPISQFIDGLQKNLWQIIYFFGGILILVSVLILVFLITIFQIFSLIYREKNAVKILLGYSQTAIYRPLLLNLVLVSLINYLLMLVIGSKIGLFYISIMVLGQFLVIWKKMTVNSIKNTLVYLKE